jgi:hypothetical protein
LSKISKDKLFDLIDEDLTNPTYWERLAVEEYKEKLKDELNERMG